MTNGSGNGRIGPAGFPDATIVAVDGVEFEVSEAGRQGCSMTRARSGTHARERSPTRTAEPSR